MFLYATMQTTLLIYIVAELNFLTNIPLEKGLTDIKKKHITDETNTFIVLLRIYNYKNTIKCIKVALIAFSCLYFRIYFKYINFTFFLIRVLLRRYETLSHLKTNEY